MCFSGIVRLHATRAEGTFLLLRESYDVFVDDAFRPKKFVSKVLTDDFPEVCSTLFLGLWSSGVRLQSEVLACAAPVSCDYMPAGPKGTFLQLTESYDVFGSHAFRGNF